MSDGIVAQLRSPLQQRADFSQVLAGSWSALSAADLAAKPVYLERDGELPLGELFDLQGQPGGQIRFGGDLSQADRLAASLTEGDVVVEGDLGAEAGVGMAGGTLDIKGNAGDRAGAAPLGFKRGMTGGELIVRGSAGAEAGAAMRRGVLVIVKQAGDRTGLGMIAGNVVLFASAGADVGLWSKRGSVIALGRITPSPTYAYACTYQPMFLRPMLARLQQRYGLAIKRKHLTGLYRRYSGDIAELGKGEILEWVAQ